MYTPAWFREERIPVLWTFMREHPFATIVTCGPEGLTASHAPVELFEDPAPFGRLRGHLARANPHWRDLEAGCDALVIFQGPQGYVSPFVVCRRRRSMARSCRPGTIWRSTPLQAALLPRARGADSAAAQPYREARERPARAVVGRRRARGLHCRRGARDRRIEATIEKLEGKWKLEPEPLCEKATGRACGKDCAPGTKANGNWGT